MKGVADADHATLERWADMHDAESVVVLDAHLGGQPVELLGIESRPLPRRGPLPVDGPSQWTAGTLFPRSSKKTARAINAASGNRPLVVLANLSGFDGSPESLRGLQLEYGAEIGRAVVNFDGPIVFCVVSRYHGGAFVVFSGTLNDNMEVAAVEGSYASVIGGAPAAAVVFAGEVAKRAAADPRVAELEARISERLERGEDVAELRTELTAIRPVVRSEKLGEVADEFDTKHSVARAQEMGSVHRIVQPERAAALPRRRGAARDGADAGVGVVLVVRVRVRVGGLRRLTDLSLGGLPLPRQRELVVPGALGPSVVADHPPRLPRVTTDERHESRKARGATARRGRDPCSRRTRGRR